MLGPFRDIFRSERAQTLPGRFSLLHVFGDLALFFLFLEIGTGILLLAYYRPTAADAFHSMGVVLDEVRLGWLIHALHAWGADFLILFSILHLAQMYFSHAYQAPRQLNWVTAVLLLSTFFMFSFTGTLLPWDQYAYWSTEMIRRTIAGVPAVGTALLNVWWGGWTIGEEVLLRFYVVHVAVLPWIATLLLSLHLFLIWHVGLGETPQRSRAVPPPRLPFFPDFVINLLIATLLVFGVVASIATFFPPAISPPADPVTPLANVKPQWYFLPVHQLLASLRGWPKALALFVLVVLLFAPPVVDGQPTQSAWRKAVRWAVGVLVIAASVFFGLQAYRS